MGFLIPQINDILDIILVAIILYEVFVITKRTGGYQILIGVIFIFFLYYAAALFNLEMMSAILRALKNVWVLAIIILFQPELRSMLSKIHFSKNFGSIFKKRETFFYGQLMDAVSSMSFRKMGALIVIELSHPLDRFIDKAEVIDASISVRLLLSIFTPGSILHDGAVIIRGERILAAKAVLPLSSHEEYLKRYGMRHMAAVGISEITDAFAIVVSEETGKVSVAQHGVLLPNIPFEELMQRIADATSK
ncbi:MAG TPA: diadenylate cyclase CdaA [Candidatus Cloacimonadota bacterium]|nr:diadenylate cyclase CdaA [Candidatus Cloacimonadota bacterium]